MFDCAPGHCYNRKMLTIDHLNKQFGDKTAVHDLCIGVPEGHLYAFLGPNGAGKTTTLKCVVGLLRPTAGRVLVGGHDMVGDPVAAKSLLAYVPDRPYLYEKLSGREFLAFVGRLYGVDRKVCAERIGELLALFDAEEWADELTENYSHGMRQKIVMCAALIHDPKVLIIDEPMVGLDPRSAKTVKTVLRERVAEGCAILMSTHTLSVAEEVADRVGIINRGRLVAEGTVAELQRTAAVSDRLEDVFLELTNADPAPDAAPAPGKG